MQREDEQQGPSRDGYNNESQPIHEYINRIQLFRNLCLGNKINSNNAFDIDMIGYFKSWLQKQKLSKKSDSRMFQEISDYLEASAKVYSFRVDHLSETTNKLLEEMKFTKINFNVNSEVQNKDGEDKLFKDPKTNRLNMMLTTADKLNDRPTAINPAVKHHLSNFSVKDIFKSGRPSDHILALFNDTTVQNELNFTTTKKKNDKEIKTIKIYDFPDINWEKEVICPDFSDFEANEDQYIEATEPDDLEFVEDYFDPNNQSVTNSMSNEVDDQKDDRSSANSNEKEDEHAIDGLLACIDSVKRDYSFFNPKLLANWNGPKEWKSQAMAKALKSKSKKHKEMSSKINLDTSTSINDLLPKTLRPKKNQEVKIEWLSTKELQSRLQNSISTGSTISQSTIKKWSNKVYMADLKMDKFEIKRRLEYLEYYEIEPHWWASFEREQKEINEKNSSLPTPYNLDNDYSDETSDQRFEPENYDINDDEQRENDNLPDSNIDKTNDDSNSEDFISNIDMEDLKKEISDIIDEEYINIDSDSKWNSQLLFSNLLQKLKVRQSLSVGIAFNCLLHLANERGLKLIQDNSIVNGRRDFYISRPPI